MASTPKITDVFAEHGYGLDRYSGARVPTTFFYRDEAKRSRIGWQHGLIEDGAVIPTSFAGEYRRIHLIGGAQAAKAA